MIDELILILIVVAVAAVCAGSLCFVEWFSVRETEGKSGDKGKAENKML